MPDNVTGWTENVTKYDYNPDKRCELLERPGKRT